MVFDSSSRCDVDIVEHDFVTYKTGHPELIEFLIPTYEASKEYEPVPVCDRELTDVEMDTARRLAPWGYSFDFSSGVSTDDIDRSLGREEAGMSEGRQEYIIRMTMLSFALKTFNLDGPWMDLATNSGVIPLQLTNNAKQSLYGVDLSEVNIRKANFLSELMGARYARFDVGDIYDVLAQTENSSFDLVSALGIFYHLIPTALKADTCPIPGSD